MKPPPLGLYVHLPWCERKCPYCDFNSHETRKIPEREYVDALLRDLEADLQLVPGRTLETLFIGGGTPSLFSAGQIETLLSGIRSRLPLAPASSCVSASSTARTCRPCVTSSSCPRARS